MTGEPSTMMRAVSGSTRMPSSAGAPSTETLPPAISSSHARREPNPARASTFCSRSGSPMRGASGLLGVLDVGVARQSKSAFERLDDTGVGDELSERRKVVERVDAETFEEQWRGAIQHRESGPRVAIHLGDVPACRERAERRLDVDASNRRDLTARDRLLVRD